MKPKIPSNVMEVMKKFVDNNADIYIVGGAIRDMFIGREMYDWDFATNLTPTEMKKLYPKNSFCENVYGTFSIVVSKEQIFEVTTYRTERGYTDGRHPDEIKWGKTIEEDLERRDFTINAMAMDINGNITDPFGGKLDIERKIIRAVRNPDERFGEDALRMIKAIRMAAELKFTIEEKTFNAIVANARLISKIAGERIKTELFRILTVNKPADGIRLLKNSGLLEIIMPELILGVDMSQKGHHIHDVWTHSLEAIDNCQSANPITRLATLLHDVGKPVVMKGEGENRTFYNHEVVGSRIAVRIGKLLRFSNKELDQLFRLVRWHMFTVEDTQTDKAVRRFIRNVTTEYLDEMISLRRADRLGSGAKESSWRWELFKKRLIEVQKQPFSITDLKVNGKDVMEILKIRPSRKVGEVLKNLFSLVEEDPNLNDREYLLKKIKEFI